MVSSEEIKRRLEEKRKIKEDSSLEKETTSDDVAENTGEILETPSETVKYCSTCDVEFEGNANFCPTVGPH